MLRREVDGRFIAIPYIREFIEVSIAQALRHLIHVENRVMERLEKFALDDRGYSRFLAIARAKRPRNELFASVRRQSADNAQYSSARWKATRLSRW